MRGSISPARLFKLLADTVSYRFYFTLLAVLVAGSEQKVAAEVNSARVVPGEYVVERAESTLESATVKGRSAFQESLGAPLGGSNFLYSKSLGRSSAYRRGAMKASAEDVMASSVPYDPNDTFCAELVAKGEAKSCSPNFVVTTSAAPSDELFSSLWGLSDSQGIKAPLGWDTKHDASDLVVAVVDTGVDYTHPDLQANMWRNPGEIAGNGVDDDANGYVDDVFGMNAVNNSGDPLDDNIHGTHVAGTIAGAGNNGVGVTGVAWSGQIMALKFLNKSGSGSIAGAVSALNYMLDMKKRGVNVRVANNSWGGGVHSAPLESLVQKLNDEGILFVAAAGNEGADNDAVLSFPANIASPNVVSVAAIDQEQNLASFSNYGLNSVHIAAPGVGILSTAPKGQYRTLSGTSMAAPHVSGALALLMSAHPELSPADARQWLMESGAQRPTLIGLTISGRTLELDRLLRGERSPILPPDTGSNCSYSSEVAVFAPDAAVQSAAILFSADELENVEINLPFAFPFYGKEVTSATVSPNGVLYFGGAPGTMDFRHGPHAPRNSIAALHTDLYAREAPMGVRVAMSADRVTINWRAFHYTNRISGEVQVWLTLSKGGAIEIMTSFSNKQVERFVQVSSLIGISGANSASAVTFAADSTAIVDGLALRFIPSCGQLVEEEVRVDSLSVLSLNDKGRNAKQVKEGTKVALALAGSGSGTVPVSVSLGSVACAQQIKAVMQSGVGRMNGLIPRGLKRISSLVFSAGSSRERIKLKRSQSAQLQAKSDKAVQHDRICAALTTSFVAP